MEATAVQVNAILEEEAAASIPIDSFVRLDRQMRALLYVWREYVKDGGRMAAAGASLEKQLIDLYQEREESGGRSYAELTATIEGLDSQLHSLYSERESAGEESLMLRQTVENFEQQLAALYSEREIDGYVSRFIGNIDIAHAARSYEEQLHAIYEEQSKTRYGITEANSMVDSLEHQVAALLEERNEIAEELVQTKQAAAQQKSRARDLITAVFDRAIV